MVYFISTFLVLVDIFMFIFGEHKLSFYISIVLWLRRYDVFYFSRDLPLKCHVNFWVGSTHPDSATYQVLGIMNLVNVDIKRFDLSRDHVIDASRDFVGGIPSSYDLVATC